MISVSLRMNAGERRSAVLNAAAAAFAEAGYEGTSTEDVARRAGISQPYVFRLFGSKHELFVAVVEQCFERTYTRFREAAEAAPPELALDAMGLAYMELVQDPVALLLQMHAFTVAVNDPVVRAVAQRGMRRVWQLAATKSGAPVIELRSWLATGMLCNMVAALGLDKLDEPWANDLRRSAEKDARAVAHALSAPAAERRAH